MLVETYECEETATEAPEMSDAALALIDKLGLDGQRSLNVSAEPKEGRCPYRRMTAEEAFVYRQICPATTNLREYAESPIPLRVLQVAAHADDYFQKLEVWHVEGITVKDPVLVGVTKDPKATWREARFILARWGEVLDEWPALSRKALELFRERTTAAIRKTISEANAKLSLIPEIDLGGAIAMTNRDF